MWGMQPWDNDRAADWFAGLLNPAFLAHVQTALRLVESDSIDEEDIPVLRAAAYCLLHFGYVYVWPAEDLKTDLTRAIQALRLVEQDEEYCYNKEIREAVKAECYTLQMRLDALTSR